MGAAAVSILKLPLSATIITLLLTSKAGIATAPLIIVAVVVAYITIQTVLRRAAAPREAQQHQRHIPPGPLLPPVDTAVRHSAVKAPWRATVHLYRSPAEMAVISAVAGPA